jgi:small subunit ribosomal protein S3
MGQKTHPTGFRLGIIKTWSSRWYEEKNYAKWLHEDLKLKSFIKKKLNHAGVSYIEIERAANKAKINIHTARPGIVIGKRGAGVETLKKEVQALTENEVFLNIIEVRKAETNAQLVAENIEAHTTYGSIGVKARVFHGEVLPVKKAGTPTPQR